MYSVQNNMRPTFVESTNNDNSALFESDASSSRFSLEQAAAQTDNSAARGAFVPSLSADGRYIAFFSDAALVTGDTNGADDIFIFDRVSGVTERITAPAGVNPNGRSARPQISADGRYVAFESEASNLVANDNNDASDVFVYDRETDTIERVSVSDSGEEGDRTSYSADLSADGRYVVYESFADNLVSDDDNRDSDIFLFDRLTRTNRRVSISAAGSQADDYSFIPTISANGRYVLFGSNASNLVENDTNNAQDLFLFDQTNGSVERVSTANGGGQSNNFSSDPEISADGRYVAFSSAASNLVENDNNNRSDIFVLDRTDGSVEKISNGTGGDDADGGSFAPQFSADGRYIAFDSAASNLVDGDNNGERDVFLYSRETGNIQLISVAADGSSGNGLSFGASFSEDSSTLAFNSTASNLVENDNNGQSDIFLATLATQAQPTVAPRRLTEKDSAVVVTETSIDLTALSEETVTVAIEVTREANYNNTVGFYVIENEQGAVKDPLTGQLINPEDAGYQAAALANRIDVTLTGENGQTKRYSADLDTRQRLSSFLVADDSIAALLDDISTNDPAVYFHYTGANSDGQQHVRLLGDGVFGYEDMVGGGDQDFNDVIVDLSF